MTKRDYVHEHFAKHPNGHINTRPAIVCKDGYTISVQASRGHYCTPRENEAERYTAVETYRIGVWSSPKCFDPVERVNKLIHRHGGPVK